MVQKIEQDEKRKPEEEQLSMNEVVESDGSILECSLFKPPAQERDRLASMLTAKAELKQE